MARLFDPQTDGLLILEPKEARQLLQKFLGADEANRFSVLSYRRFQEEGVADIIDALQELARRP